MKKLRNLILLSLFTMTIACNKEAQNPVKSINGSSVTRTVGPITFTGQIAWFKFGTREEVSTGDWQCMSSYDYCQYEYMDDVSGQVPTNGEATGEIGYDGTTLLIALDKISMTTTDVQGYYTRDGEFHRDANGYYTTSGFDIKNTQDDNQNTIGDIHVDAGVYPVYEDDHSILVIFDEP